MWIIYSAKCRAKPQTPHVWGILKIRGLGLGESRVSPSSLRMSPTFGGLTKCSTQGEPYHKFKPMRCDTNGRHLTTTSWLTIVEEPFNCRI
jgi:hypothetical protein